MKTYTIVACAFLAAAALALQLANPVLGIHTGFGMTVDLVALPALLALFVFGFEAAFYVLLVSVVGIAMFAPTGVIGATMKFIATLPMLLVPSALLLCRERKKAAAGAIALIVLLCALTYAFVGFSRSWAGGIGADALVGGALPLLALLLCSIFIFHLSKEYRKGESGAYSGFALAVGALLLALFARGVLTVLANFFISGPLFFGISPSEFVSFVQKANFLFLGSGVPWYFVIFFWNALQGAIEFLLAWVLAYKFNLVRFGK